MRKQNETDASLNAAPAAKNLGNETPAAMGVVNQETGLAPCPFCGRADGLYIDDDPHAHSDVRYTVECVCGASGAPRKTIELAKEFWNKRAPQISSLPKTPVVTTKGKE